MAEKQGTGYPRQAGTFGRAQGTGKNQLKILMLIFAQ